MKHKLKIIAVAAIAVIILAEVFHFFVFGESWLVNRVATTIKEIAYYKPIPKNLLVADETLSEKIKREVIVVDSYLRTSKGNSYQVIVFSKNNSDFDPIAIQGPAKNNGRIFSSRLAPERDFSCVGIGVNQDNNRFPPSSSDLSVAYLSRFMSGRNIDVFANQDSKAVDLIIQYASHSYIIKDVSIQRGCYWYIE